ncbi:MAG: DUF421 domain-containing protein [Oscillospiraceae bacterium]|nr:DUF421 domain-containing protein [Oscillospiraceae bacterium]
MEKEVKTVILSYFRTIILYGVLIAAVRLMGKRQIGQMEASEFVVAMLVADLASIPMQDVSIPLLSGLVPMLTILGLELCLSYLIMKSLLFRKLLCGKPVILINNGKILEDNLRRTRVTLDELLGNLRQKDVLDITSVQYAILETDGNLSVFPFPENMPASAKDAGIAVPAQSLPVTIISDGTVFREELNGVGKNEAWLRKTLKKHGAHTETTLLLTVDGQEKVTWIGKEKEH